MKRIATLVLALALLPGLAGCTLRLGAAPEGGRSVPATQAAEALAAAPSTYADATTIILGKAIAIDGPGASARGQIVTIAAGGDYVLRGALQSGQIVVDAKDHKDVTLVLDGVDITCPTSAPLYVMDAKDVEVVLAEGSANHLADGESYLQEDPEEDEPNAALFSKSDLVLSGSGALRVEAHYNDGIASKDELEIRGGQITVTAVGDGIRGRDSIVVTGGQIAVSAGADGLKATNDEDPERGFVSLEGGALDITAGQDGIQAETAVTVRAGEIAISSGGGSVNSSQQGSSWGNWGTPRSAPADDTPSAKGIKGLTSVTIAGGTLRIDASDDALHSNGSLAVSGGQLDMASGDDGIHADATITISGGEIEIAKSYEGIESAVIVLSGGTIHVTSRDDGINVAGGNDASALGGRPGQNTFRASGDRHLKIEGGYIVVDATGDGLDINGSVKMTDGVLIVHGPTSDHNGALDYDAGFQMTGGFLAAAGSAGMAQAPDSSSTQRVVLINLAAPLPAGTLFHLETEQGQEIVTLAPRKAYQSVVVCAAELVQGERYVATTGGSATGTLVDGVYAGGAYQGGSEVARFAIEGVVTGIGRMGRFPGGRR